MRRTIDLAGKIVTNDEATCLLSELSCLLIPPHYDVSRLLVYGDIDVTIGTAWGIAQDYYLMLLVLRSIDSELSIRAETRTKNILGEENLAKNDHQVFREGSALIRGFVPELPPMMTTLISLRGSQRVYIRAGDIPNAILASASRDPLRNIILEISSYGRPACTFPGRADVEVSLGEAWAQASFDTQILMLRLIRPAWWEWFVSELAHCSSNDEVKLLMDGIVPLLPTLQELADSAPRFQYDLFPDPFS